MFGSREAYGLKEAGLLTLNYPRAERPGRLPDDHLVPVGLPNMWTTFKVRTVMVKSSIKFERGVQVVDRQSGLPVGGPDLQGELCIKTCQLMPGYWEGGVVNTDDILDSDGFFHTGDLGYYDKDGVIYFVEQVRLLCFLPCCTYMFVQISCLISFWMYEIAPCVLECRLLSHTSVVDAAVVAIPDKENGQIPRAFVVLKVIPHNMLFSVVFSCFREFFASFHKLTSRARQLLFAS